MIWEDLRAVREGMGGLARVWEALIALGRLRKGLGRGWEALGGFKGFGKVWEGLGGFGRVRESLEGFGRVWECQNCVTVIENNCSGEFGRIWVDLEMPKVCNFY